MFSSVLLNRKNFIEERGDDVHEQNIIQLIKERNEKGAEELLKHYGPLMRYIIAPILPNEHDQEECIAEVSLRVWGKIQLFDSGKGSWNAWLTAITRNTALNRARQMKTHESLEEISTEIPSQALTPEEIVLKKERQAQLIKAMNSLSAEERKLFYRKYYYLQSTAQIAAELGTTERAVEGKLYRLKRRLRKMLGGELDE